MSNNCIFCKSEKLNLLWKGHARSGSLKQFSKKVSLVFQCKICKSIKLKHEEEYDIKNFKSGQYRKKVSYVNTKNLEVLKEKINFLNLLYKYFTNKNILDFGCGNGYFLKLIKNFNKKCIGIEIDKYSSKNKDVEILPSLDDLKKYKIKFDVIVLFSCLGMLENLESYLSKMKKYLKRNGFLIIGDVNAQDYLVQNGIKNYQKIFYRLSYKNYFSLKGIEILLNEKGFKLENAIFYNRYDYQNFKKNLNRHNQLNKKINNLNFSNFLSNKKGTDYLITIFKKI